MLDIDTVIAIVPRVSGDQFRYDDELRRRVRVNLETFERRAYRDRDLKPAAVAVVLVADEKAQPCFVLTRRALKLRTHRGQWALPGGRIEAGESAEQAALRELGEEVGLELDGARVLGLLDDYPTRSGYVITPVVAWGGCDAALKANPGEVDAVYRIPVADLDRPEVPRLRNIPESRRPVISIPLDLVDADIHAPTAAVLYQLREVALWGRNTRVAHYEQPVFAWQ